MLASQPLLHDGFDLRRLPHGVAMTTKTGLTKFVKTGHSVSYSEPPNKEWISLR